MRKGKLIGRIFGIRLIFVTVGLMLGKVANRAGKVANPTSVFSLFLTVVLALSSLLPGLLPGQAGLVSASSQTELITNGGFESGSTGWSVNGDFYADSRFSHPHSGTGYAYLSNADGTYGNNLAGTLEQTVTIPSSATSAMFTFWYSITTNEPGPTPYDLCDVIIFDTHYNWLATAASLDNADSQSPISYSEASLDLTDYVGQTVKIVVEATTDASYPTVFRLDDFSILATLNKAPTCSLSAYPTSGNAPLDVTFTLSANDPDGYISAWVLDVDGDGNKDYFGTGSPPTTQPHTYTAKGSYSVAFIVSDNDGKQSTPDTETVAVGENQPPACSLFPDKSSGKAPLTVTFTMSASDSDGYISAWVLRPGDGSPDYSGSGSPPSTQTHTYKNSGTYTAVLMVSDNDDVTRSDIKTIVVTVNDALSLECEVSPDPTTVGHVTNFTAAASGGVPPYFWSWTVNGTPVAGDQNTTYNFTDAGNYTVCVTVTDALGNWMQCCTSVTVNPALSLECDVSPNPTKVGHVTDFTAAASGGVLPYSWSWTIDGIEVSTAQNTTHIFATAGNYNVCVNVTDSLGNEEQCCTNVTINPALSLVLLPETDTNPVGTTHRLTATLYDQFGYVMEGVDLTWSITGVGSFSGTPESPTDVNGQADAVITSSVSGTSTVRCEVTGDTSIFDTATKTWTAGPKTWYVDDDKLDYLDADFTKIQEAVDAASPGDTIIVYAGTYTENVDVNKDHLTIKSENGAETTIVQAANPNDHVFELTADYVNISGFTVKGANGKTTTGLSSAGICLKENRGCNISKNIPCYNTYGIFCFYSPDNILTNNTASYNDYNGIFLWSCPSNVLIDNIASYNPLAGIRLLGSPNTILTGNLMSSNPYNFAVGGNDLSAFIHDIDTSNKVDGKAMQYLIGENGLVIDSSWDVGYLGLINCSNITVKDLSVTHNHAGILLAFSSNSRIENTETSRNGIGIDLQWSSNNTLTNNTVFNNRNGIRLYLSPNNTLGDNMVSHSSYDGVGLWWSSSNILTHNTVSNNYRSGICICDSSKNEIYLNSLIGNTDNAYHHIWDQGSTNIWNSPEEITYTYNGNTYSSYLGNHWSDYSGSDADGDGIGNTSYPIDSNSDNYPLMERFENYEIGDDTTLPNVSSVSPEDGATSVPIGADVMAIFSEAIDETTIDEISFTLAGSTVSGTVEYDHVTYTATFDPDTDLDYNHTYTATLSTAITDLAGNPLAEPHNWNFTTKSTPGDITPPETEIISGPSGTIDYNDVTFIWTGSDDVTASSELVYSYYLEGYDDDWSDWTLDTSKSYNDLSNGDYNFKVKAKDQADNIDPTPAKSVLTISVVYRPELSVPIYAPISQTAHTGTRLKYLVTVANRGQETDTVEIEAKDDPELAWNLMLMPSLDGEYPWVSVDHNRYQVELPPEGSTEFYVYVELGDPVVKSVDKIEVWAKSTKGDCEPAHYTLQAESFPDNYGLFVATLKFTNPGEETDILIFTVPRHATISDTYIWLGPSETKWINVMFDPSSREDAFDTWVEVESADTGKRLTIPIEFGPYDEILATGFDMAEDSYRFENPLGLFCYGMSETSILYFQGELSLPPNKPNTYSLTKYEAWWKIFWHQRIFQRSFLENMKLKLLDVDLEEEYSKLKTNILNGNPMILGVRDHAVVAYKICEGGGKSYIWLYDNELPYPVSQGQSWPQHFRQAFPYATYDLVSHEFSYGEHNEFLALEAEKLPMEEVPVILIVACPVNVTVADQFGHIINDLGANEIPGAGFLTLGEDKVFYLPKHMSYSVTIQSYEQGEFDLSLIFPVGEANALITHFPNVSVTPNTQACTEIEPGVHSYTIEIDYDGDGSSDETLTPDVSETLEGNQPPKAKANGCYLADEGSAIDFDASGSGDPDSDPLQYRWDFDNDGLWDTEYSADPVATYTWGDEHFGIIKLEVTDGELTSVDTAEVTVNNVPPTVDAGLNVTAECCVDEISLNATFTDLGWLDSHTATINWGDGTIENGTLTEENEEPDANGTVIGTHKYCFPDRSATGDYIVTVTVTDDDGDVDSDTSVVTVVDTSSPQVSVQLIPIDVEEDEGLFEVSYNATDTCELSPEVVALILTPQLMNPEVEFQVEDQIELEYDLEENEVEVKGPDPEALWEEIQDLGGLRVELGQQVYIEPEENSEELEIKYEEGVLKIEGLSPTLKVTSTDASGNEGEAIAQPVFMS